MEITIKIQHNDDMRSITLISPTGDTLRIFSEEAIDFFHGVEQSHKHGVMQGLPVAVRGGANEAVIVHGNNTITNDQSQTTTLTTPTEPLPAEGLAQNGSVDLCLHTPMIKNGLRMCMHCLNYY